MPAPEAASSALAASDQGLAIPALASEDELAEDELAADDVASDEAALDEVDGADCAQPTKPSAKQLDIHRRAITFFMIESFPQGLFILHTHIVRLKRGCALGWR